MRLHRRIGFAGATLLAVTLAAPSLRAQIVARSCDNPADSTTGVVYGEIKSVESGRGVAGATVTAGWTEYTLAGLTLKRRLRQVTAVTDSTGAYRLCGVPARIRSDVTVALDASRAGPVGVELGTIPSQRLDLTLSVGAAAFGGVSGVARAADGRPAPGVELRFNGFDQSVRSGADGRFKFARVPSGTRELEARKVGGVPARVVVDVPAGGDANADVAIDQITQSLPSVAIVGTNDWRDRAGFDERRLHKPGFFRTAEQITNMNAWDIADVTYRAPWVWSEMVNGRRYVQFATASLQRVPVFKGPGGRANVMPMSMSRAGGCVPKVFLNGEVVLGTDYFTALDMVIESLRPDDLYGMEMYRPGGYTPPQFVNSAQKGCGTVVFWTK